MDQQQGRLQGKRTTLDDLSAEANWLGRLAVVVIKLISTALLTFALLGNSAVADTQVSILLSGNNPAYSQFADSFTRAVSRNASSPITVRKYLLQDALQLAPEVIESQIVLSIGAEATGAVLAAPLQGRVITAFVTRNALKKLAESHRHSANDPTPLLGGIYLDQPASRLLHTARLLEPTATTIGMLTGRLSGVRLKEFSAGADELGLKLRSAELQKEDNPVVKLESLIAGSDVYIVLPDRAEFNRTTAKWIIYLSYRYGVPVIAYSSRYVDAGALVSVFTTPEQMGQQAAELTAAVVAGEVSLPRWEYPKDYQVRINKKVARSLGYPELDSNKLLRELTALEPSQTNRSTRQEGVKSDE